MSKIKKAINIIEDNYFMINGVCTPKELKSFNGDFSQYLIKQLKLLQELQKLYHSVTKLPNVNKELTCDFSIKEHCMGMTLGEIKSEFTNNFNPALNQLYINHNYYQLAIDGTFGDDTDICDDAWIILTEQPTW